MKDLSEQIKMTFSREEWAMIWAAVESQANQFRKQGIKEGGHAEAISKQLNGLATRIDDRLVG